MNQKKCGRRGSIIVESVLIFPLLILSILALGCLIRVFYIHESVHMAAVDQAVKLSVEAAIEKTGSMSVASYNMRLKNKLKELDKEVSNLFCILEEDDNCIKISVQYSPQIMLPVQFEKDIRLGDTIYIKTWSGDTEDKNPMSFSEMESAIESEIVYIFPKAGKRYHRKSCSMIDVSPRQDILTEQMKKNYLACMLCDAKQMQTGTMVYYYETSGQAYHSKNCYCITKIIKEMDLHDALEAGYSPCKKCY